MNTSFLNKWHTAIRGFRHSVYLYAYTNFNVGDDLFLHKLISSYPDVCFVLIAQKPYRDVFSRHPNVTVYEEGSFPLSLCKKLRLDGKIRWRISHDCDYAVLIGGSVFKEDSKWENQQLWYRDLFDHDRLYFLGCSWGPCKTESFEADMTEIFSDVKDICFRDRYSYNTFAHLGNVRYAPDILFGLDWSPYRGIPEKKQVLISVIDCRSESAELAEYASAYNRFIGHLVARFSDLGYRVILCSFCENQGDLAAAEAIRNSFSAEVQQHTSITNYDPIHPEQLLTLIAASEYVVATRFHAMILGLAAGKKVLPVIYHMKQQKALDDLSFRGAVCDIRNLPENPAALIGEITRGISEEERARLAALSAGHFDKLSSVLNSPE